LAQAILAQGNWGSICRAAVRASKLLPHTTWSQGMATSRSCPTVYLAFMVASVSQLAARVSAQQLRGKAEMSSTAAEGPGDPCEAAKARPAGRYSCGERLANLTSAGQSLNEGIDQLVNLEFPTSCGDDLLFCRSPPPEAEAVALCSAAKLQAAGAYTCGHVLGDLRRRFTTDEAIDQLANYFEGACRNLVYCKDIALVPAPAATPAPTPEPASEPTPAPTSCKFSVVFCDYSAENWELMVGECSPDGRGGAYRVDKPSSPNPFDPECGIASPYFVNVEHYPEENCTSAKDDSSFMVFTDGYCGNCCDINTGVCNSLCAGFLSPA